jgi:YD repeat-containing protein
MGQLGRWFGGRLLVSGDNVVASKLGSAVGNRLFVAALFLLIALVVSSGLARPARADNAQYFYDADGRLVGVIDPVKGSAQYTYDATGNILSVTNNPITAVAVVQFSPATGPTGTVVTIAGTGFDTASDTSVNFNGTTATPSAVTSTSITVAVPAGATTGPVSVTAPGGNATSTTSYTVATPPSLPQIASFSPTTVGAGDTLTITGSNFDTVNAKVEINGMPAHITSATSTSLVVTIPVASSGRILVESPTGSALSSSYLIVAPPGYAAGMISTAQQAILPSSGGSVSATGNVNTAGQLAVIYFDVTAPTAVSLVETANSINFGGFELFGPDGTEVSPTASNSNQANAVVPAQTLLRSGTYSIVTTSNYFGDLFTGSATFTIYNLPPLSLAAPQTAGGAPGTETVTTPGQVPTFTFFGTAGQSVDLAMAVSPANGFQHTILVTAPDYAQVYTASNGSSTNVADAVTLLETGIYTYQVIPFQPMTGTVTFQADVPIVGSITVGGPAVTENVAELGDTVTLSFTGTAGQHVRLVTQLDPAFSPAFWNAITITEPDGQTRLYSSAHATVSDLSGVLVLPTSGTYTIQFNPAGAVTGNVTMQLDVPLTGTLTFGGAAVTESVTEAGDVVSLSFAGTAGQGVQLFTQIDPAFDPGFWNTVIITEPDGQTQLYNSPHVAGSTDLSGFLTLPTTGTYTAAFTPAGPAAGNVTMQLEAPLTGTLTLGGSAVTEAVTAPGDVVSLSFAGTAGQAVQLFTQIDPAFDPAFWNTVIITEPNGQQLYYSEHVNGSTDLSGFLILPATGTYTAKFTPAGPATGNVTMQLEAPLTGTLTLGGPAVTEAVTAPGDVVSLSFAGTAGQALRLLTEIDPAFDPAFWNAVIIIEPNGQQLYYSEHVNGAYDLSGVLTLPSTGTYTAQFVPAGAATGNVTMELDQPIASTIVVGGPPVGSSVTAPGDNVSLSFAGTAGQSVRLLTQIDPAFDPAAWNEVIITEPNGQQLYNSSRVAGAYDLSGVLTLPATGTYTAQFIPAGPATGDVTMQLGATLTGSLAVGGPTVTQDVTAPGDAVILTFTGTAGQAVELLTQIDSAFDPAFWNTVVIVDPDGQTQLYNSEHVNGTSDLSNVLTLPTTGTYTAQFIPAGAATGNVSMTLYDGGTSVLGATDFTASIPTAGATAQLAFTGSSGSRVSLQTVADTNLRQGCFTISIIEPGGTTQLYSNTQSSPTDFSQALTLPASGLYTMLLVPCGSATGTAALTLYSLPPDASGSTTIGGSAVSLTTVVPGQNAQVILPTSGANQTANISVTADANYSSACYNVTVTAPGGAVVNTGQGCGTSYSTGVLTLAAAGTYNIAIASVSTATGNVTVGVTAR